jgi:hypothetical protein
MATTSVAYPAQSKFNSIDFLLISIWACLLFLCLAIPHLFYLLWDLLGGGVLIGHHFWSVVRKGQPRDGNLVIAVAMPVAALIFTFVFAWVDRATPVTYDNLLASWDHGISASVRSWTLTRPWISSSLLFVYMAMPTAILVTIVLTRKFRRARLVWSTILGALLVVPCFLLFPAVGPIHVGDPNAPRNCVPSMHLTWALFLWINTRGWVKWVTGIFAALTAVATISTGEHYVFDLLVALPWTWFITVLAGWLAKRSLAEGVAVAQ